MCVSFSPSCVCLLARHQMSCEKAATGPDVKLSALWHGGCYHALIAGVGLVVLQQITGQPSVLYYTSSIFADVGLTSIASILVGAFKLIATLVAVFTADKFGRRKLLVVGCSFMLVSLFGLGIAFLFDYVSAEDCEMNLDEVSAPSCVVCAAFALRLLISSFFFLVLCCCIRQAALLSAASAST